MYTVMSLVTGSAESETGLTIAVVTWMLYRNHTSCLLLATNCSSRVCSRVSLSWPLIPHVYAACRDYVLQQQQQQQQALPDRVVVSTGRSRQRDHVSSILRDSTTALLSSWGSPFAAFASENGNASSASSSKLEASGAAVSGWLQQVR
jgi:hypothetical protein